MKARVVDREEGECAVERHYDLLAEERFVANQMNLMMGDAFFSAKTISKKPIFISYSRADRAFVQSLVIDLEARGFSIWLDDREMGVGEVLHKSIAKGVSSAELLVLVLSKSSVKSKWVDLEIGYKLHEEIESGKVKVLPVLKEKCAIPYLLKNKKYADFSREYVDGLNDLVLALNKFSKGSKLVKPISREMNVYREELRLLEVREDDLYADVKKEILFDNSYQRMFGKVRDERAYYTDLLEKVQHMISDTAVETAHASRSASTEHYLTKLARIFATLEM